MAYLKNGKELKQQSGNEEECFLYKKKKKKKIQTKRTDYIAKCIKGLTFFSSISFRYRVGERESDWDWVGEAERVSGLGPSSAMVTLREWEEERVSESVGLLRGWVRRLTDEGEWVGGWLKESDWVGAGVVDGDAERVREGEGEWGWARVSVCRGVWLMRESEWVGDWKRER